MAEANNAEESANDVNFMVVLGDELNLPVCVLLQDY
jgi:hypothetical protein